MDFKWFRYLFGLPSKNKLSNIKAYILVLVNISIFSAIIFTLISQRWVAFLVAIFVLSTIWATRVVAKKNNLVRPAFFEFIMTIFLYTALILGDVQNFYQRFEWWDKLLHFSSGIAFVFIGFLIFYSIEKSNKNRSVVLVTLFAFSFALATGVIWETAEFISDTVLETTSQNGLVDTMLDLSFATLGAVIASTWAVVLFEK